MYFPNLTDVALERPLDVEGKGLELTVWNRICWLVSQHQFLHLYKRLHNMFHRLIMNGQGEKNVCLSAWLSVRPLQFSSLIQLCPTLCNPMDCCSICGLPVHHQLPELTQTHVHWVSDAIQPSYPLLSPVPFSSSCFQSFPASVSFPMSQFFTSGARSIRISASASIVPMNIQDRDPLGWTGWISLQSTGFSRVFSNTTVQKRQSFSA